MLDIEPSVCICLAAAVLLLPLHWCVSLLIAAVVHEMSHLGIIVLTGGKVQKISVSVRGMVIQADISSSVSEGVCAIAGPIGGLLLVLLARWFPRLALCALIQSVWNLIPVYPLDGGRAMKVFLQHIVPKCADAFLECITVSAICILCVVGVYCTLYLRLGLLPMFLPAVVLIKTGKIKIPCKASRIGVQ